MATDKPFTKGMTMEQLMKLRIGTAEHHLESVGFDSLLDEVIDLKKKLADQDEMICDLREHAMSDPLTGVANRRTFEKEMRRSLELSRRYGRQHGLLLIDVDNFKTVNDRLGHVFGDQVLKHIVSLIRQNIRGTDIISRLGGDEFCVILNELKSEGHAAMRARAIEDVVEKTPCIGTDHTVQVSVSAGYYVFDSDDKIEAILQRADESMYAQKARTKQAG